MKNANMGFNPEGISSINKLLEARELTGRIPETMPEGLTGGYYCDGTGACECSNCWNAE